MASSPVDLCNLALAHLGEAPIAALDDDTAAGRACATCYEVTRDEVLRSHRWNFATKRVLAVKLATAPAFGWSAAFALPADCLRVLEVNDSESGASAAWIIEGRSLLLNAGECRLLYIASVQDVTLFDSVFATALALRLGAVLAEIIRGATGKTADLMAQYERVTAPLARRVDANEARRRKGLLPQNSLAIKARFGPV